MPHQCTNCDRRFPDGSKEMLSGCPDCGGNRFQFTPASSSSAEASDTDADPTSSANGPATKSAADSSTKPTADSSNRESPETAQRPAERDDSVGRSTAESGTDAMEDDFEWVTGEEDDAQATARSDIVSPDELPAHGTTGGSVSSRTEGPTPGLAATDDAHTQHDAPERTGDADEPDRPEHDHVGSEPADDQPSIKQLRAELNQQFESIKILNPGQYELNLMELYDREEQIVSLQEDGRYVINVPGSWHES